MMWTGYVLDDAAWFRNRLRWTAVNVVLSVLVVVALVLAAPAMVDL